MLPSQSCCAPLGTEVPLTVFRKLKELSYHTSYSHRGRFYTLDEIARFDQQGLWSFGSVWFSRYGTLLATAEAFVNQSPAGCLVSELEDVLHAGVQDPLLHLVRINRITRQPVSGLFLYCSADPATNQRQLLTRRAHQSELALTDRSLGFERSSEELKAGIILFYSVLDEKQRRLYAGLEALKLGSGGDRQIAAFLGMDPHTVSKGRRELLSQQVQRERVRQPGAGRKPVEKKRPK